MAEIESDGSPPSDELGPVVLEPGDFPTRADLEAQIGRKFDGGKPDWTLVPMGAVEEIVKVLMFGAQKYERDNWQHVEDGERRYLAAAVRHLGAVIDGEDLDPESGLPHLAHAGCCVLFALWLRDHPQ